MGPAGNIPRSPSLPPPKIPRHVMLGLGLLGMRNSPGKTVWVPGFGRRFSKKDKKEHAGRMGGHWDIVGYFLGCFFGIYM